jgi:phosphopantetheinyl transferase
MAYSKLHSADVWRTLGQDCRRAVDAGAMFVVLAEGAHALADASVLSSDEYAALQRLRDPRRRAAYVLGRTLVAHLLARPGSGRPPPAIVDRRGKPAVQGAPHFNLSHAGRYLACAICAKASVGIDIELCSRIGSPRSLIPLMAHEREAVHLQACADAALPRLFRTAWTRKEALLKACGLGLSYDARRIDVSLSESSPVIEVAGTPGPLRVKDFMRSHPEVGGALAFGVTVDAVHGCMLSVDAEPQRIVSAT